MKQAFQKTVLGLSVGAILLSPMAPPFAWAASGSMKLRAGSPMLEEVLMRSVELKHYLIDQQTKGLTGSFPGWKKLSGPRSFTGADAKEVRSLNLRSFIIDEDYDLPRGVVWEEALSDLSNEEKFPNLKALTFTGEQYKFICDNHLSLPPQLEKVYVSGTIVENVHVTLEPLEGVKQLKTLSLHDVTLDDTHGLEKHVSLESLRLVAIHQDLDGVEDMAYDAYISLLKSHLPAMDLSFLNHLSHLKHLKIDGYVAEDLRPLHDTPSFENLRASKDKFPPMEIALYHFAKLRHDPKGATQKEAYFQLFDLENLTMPMGEKISSKYLSETSSEEIVDGNPARLAFKLTPYSKPGTVAFLDEQRYNATSHGRDLMNQSFSAYLFPEDFEGYPIAGLYVIVDLSEFSWENELFGKTVNSLKHEENTPYEFSEEDLKQVIPSLPENAKVKVLNVSDFDDSEWEKYLTEDELEKIENMTTGEIQEFLETFLKRPAVLDGKIAVHINFYDGSAKDLFLPVEEQTEKPSEPTPSVKPEKPDEEVKGPEEGKEEIKKPQSPLTIAIQSWGYAHPRQQETVSPVEKLLVHDAYMKGYPDGAFRPDGALTRAEAAAIFARLEGLDTSETNAPGFADTKDPSAWYNGTVQAVVKANVMKGYPDGTFRPDVPMTRAEFSQLLGNKVGISTVESPYPDVKGHWAQEVISRLTYAKVLLGYPDGSFRPEASVTRAEATKVFNRLYARRADGHYLKNHGELSSRFKDVSSEHWAFGEVMEASVPHRFSLGTNQEEIWKDHQ